ncbi:ribonuclease HII [Candidatus Dependentiae bacterium]|nr:ribonuclease HII [Candidatus Dependentiae bacterium]
MSDNKLKILVGIDDATKCPVIGSIFISGVIADEKTIRKWKRAGVKDSKLIAAKKRTQLAEEIKKTALAYSIQELKPNMIDDKSLGLNDWEMVVVLNIIQDLQNKYPDFQDVYIDNWEVSEKRFRQRFTSITTDFEIKDILLKYNIQLNAEKLSSINYIAEHRADEKYTVVGAASILSKTSSDLQYKEYKEIYGDFGSGSPGDPKTRLFVWEHREDPLPIIRTSWNTYKVLSACASIDDDYFYARKKAKLATADFENAEKLENL